ncbi:DMT family transporter [Microbacterium sp. C7(2022)]|uniref:DMT family transporter n=1 Tax=Microbacterium sp. C7(2022) TaxID=2992759 RepID=UPI00237A6B46|nr:DMT family transporter [Microbacterium sp. C7(2022)]MDE0546025.1 DMT family transporter [Microbacterium sp. C7(2022)]
MNAAVVRFDTRAWILFGIMAVLWGMPYLFIKIAVADYTPAAIVAARTLLGGLVLLPFALRARALRPAFRKIGWVLAFGAVEMAGPFLLLGHAEQTIPSGLTGLLVSTVPLFAALTALAFSGDRSVLHPVRMIGLIVGFAGVAVVVAGPGFAVGGAAGFIAVGEVLLVAVLYAVAPFIVAHKLKDVPSLGTVTVALLSVGVFYLPFGLITQSALPDLRLDATAAVVALGVFCTALALVAFFALIARVGPARAPLFTYVNPVIAILLGAVLLGEAITPSLLMGFPLIIVGCWLAATGGTMRAQRAGKLPPVAPG